MQNFAPTAEISTKVTEGGYFYVHPMTGCLVTTRLDPLSCVFWYTYIHQVSLLHTTVDRKCLKT